MWLLGGTGVFLLYSAYKNQKPQALLATYVNGTETATPISTYGKAATATGANPDGTPKKAEPGAGFDTFPTPKKAAPGAGLDTFSMPRTSTRQDISGTWNLIDSAGRMIGVVPADYQKTPQLYIPAVTV